MPSMGNIAKIVLLLCLLCFDADAQHRRWLIAPKPSSGGADPMTFGIAHRWIFTNIVTDPVSDWVDIVQGNTLYQSPGPAQPDLTTNGLFFSDWNGEFLAATNFVFTMAGGTNDFFVLIGAVTNTGVSGTFLGAITHRLLGHDNTGTWITPFNETYGSVVANQFYDLAFGRQYSGTNAQYYTNGTPALLSTNIALVWDIKRVGSSGGGGGWLDGFIKEMIHWTNVGAFSDAQVQMIHKYATNAYGYSP